INAPNRLAALCHGPFLRPSCGTAPSFRPPARAGTVARGEPAWRPGRGTYRLLGDYVDRPRGRGLNASGQVPARLESIYRDPANQVEWVSVRLVSPDGSRAAPVGRRPPMRDLIMMLRGLFAPLALVLPATAHAEVRLGPLFRDHAVLQQGKP